MSSCNVLSHRPTFKCVQFRSIFTPKAGWWWDFTFWVQFSRPRSNSKSAGGITFLTYFRLRWRARNLWAKLLLHLIPYIQSRWHIALHRNRGHCGSVHIKAVLLVEECQSLDVQALQKVCTHLRKVAPIRASSTAKLVGDLKVVLNPIQYAWCAFDICYWLWWVQKSQGRNDSS
jgi:hypothetical protein